MINEGYYIQLNKDECIKIPEPATENFEYFYRIMIQTLDKDFSEVLTKAKNKYYKDYNDFHDCAFHCMNLLNDLEELEMLTSAVKQRYIKNVFNIQKINNLLASRGVDRKNEPIKLSDLATYTQIFIEGSKANGKIRATDTKTAREKISLPEGKTLIRICNNMREWWNLEGIPPFFGVIIARVIYGYYKANINNGENGYTKLNDLGVLYFTALKIGQILKPANEPQKKQLETIESVIGFLCDIGGLPYKLCWYGSVRPQNGQVVKAWCVDIYTDYDFDDQEHARHNGIMRNYDTSEDGDILQISKETQERREKDFINFMQGTQFINIDTDILTAQDDSIKTTQQICAFFYIALLISETRQHDEKTFILRIDDLYKLCGNDKTTGANRRTFYNKYLMGDRGIISNLKTKGIIKEVDERPGDHNKNETLYITV